VRKADPDPSLIILDGIHNIAYTYGALLVKNTSEKPQKKQA
jgi:hypothetical protein